MALYTTCHPNFGSGGGGGGGAANSAEFVDGWIIDDNTVVHYYRQEYDENTGAFGPVVYTDAPGGSVTTPTFPVEPTGGAGTASVTFMREFLTGWVRDDNDVDHWFVQVFDEEAGSFGAVAYSDSPGGSATTPTGSVRPITTTDDPNVQVRGEWVADEGGSAHWLVSTYDADTGSLTYATFLEPNGIVTIPAGALVPIEASVVDAEYHWVRDTVGVIHFMTLQTARTGVLTRFFQDQPNGTTTTPTGDVTPLSSAGRQVLGGWVLDGNREPHYYVETYDDSTNAMAIVFYDAPGGSVTTPVAPLRAFDGGENTAALYYVEVVRLDGDLATVAVPEIPVHPGNGAQQDLVPGNTYSITGERKDVAWRFLRETVQDAQLDINSHSYLAGSGPIYSEIGYGDGGNDVVYDYDLDFTAQAGCFVEIRITRRV